MDSSLPMELCLEIVERDLLYIHLTKKKPLQILIVGLAIETNRRERIMY